MANVIRVMRSFGRAVVVVCLLMSLTGCSRVARHTRTQQDAPLPLVANVTCDGTTTRVSPPYVQPQHDGVHLSFENSSDRGLGYSLIAPGGGGSGGGLEPGTTSVIDALPVGSAGVLCTELDQDPKDLTAAKLEVIDDQGVWVSTELGCASGMGVGGSGSYPPGVHGHTDLLEGAREDLAGLLQEGDTVERAGYSEQEAPAVRVVRAGETIIVATYFADGFGGWLQDGYTACGDPEALEEGAGAGSG